MSSECAVESVPAGYKHTEVGVIPEDWDVKSIGDIVSISVGRDLKEDNLALLIKHIYLFIPVFH
jgi:type I restriction enzyme S subunit